MCVCDSVVAEFFYSVLFPALMLMPDVDVSRFGVRRVICFHPTSDVDIDIDIDNTSMSTTSTSTSRTSIGVPISSKTSVGT